MSEIICVMIGGGGHAAVLLDCLRAQSGVLLMGVLDREPERLGSDLLGVPVLGRDDQLYAIRQRGATHFVVGVGGVGNNRPRLTLFDNAIAAGLQPLTVRHPASICSPYAEVSKGAQLLPGSIVNTNASVGANTIVNTGAIVEHDCVVEAHVHIATGARLAGSVHVGEGAHIGVGATIRQDIVIGAWAVVGAGAVVVKNVKNNTVVAGVPARVLPPKAV